MEKNKKINDWQDVDIDDWQDIDLQSSSNTLMPQETPDSLQLKKRSEALGKSFLDSLLMGTSSKIAGLSESALSRAFDVYDVNKELSEKGFTGDIDINPYETGKKEYEQNVEQLQSDFPITSGIGTIAGAVVPSKLISNIVGGAAKTAGYASNNPLIKNILLSTAKGTKGIGGAKNLALGLGAEGAVGGALLGAGKSDNLNELPENVMDSGLESALFASLAGGTLGAGKNILKSIAETPIAQEAKEYYKLGKKHNVSGWSSKDTQDILESVFPKAEKTIKTLDNELISKVAQERDSALKKVTEPINLNFNSITEQAPSFTKTIKGKQTIDPKNFDNLSPNQQKSMAELTSAVESFSQSPKNGEEILNFWKELKKAKSKVKNNKDLEMYISEIESSLSSQLDNIENVNFKSKNMDLKLLYDIKENLTGNRVQASGVSTSEELDKLLRSLDTDKQLTGDTSKLFKAKKAISELPEELQTKTQDTLEEMIETRKLAQGTTKQNLFNRQATRPHIRATSMAMGKMSNTLPFGKITDVASKVIAPGTLYDPKVMMKLSKHKTISNIYEQLADTSVSEAKKRALQNILLNNPVVRRAVLEDNEE